MGRFFLCDEAGNTISNGYSGSVEVRRYEEGYTVVNSVPFETYLTAVVPSEMPSTYEKRGIKGAGSLCEKLCLYSAYEGRSGGFPERISTTVRPIRFIIKVEAGEASRQGGGGDKT